MKSHLFLYIFALASLACHGPKEQANQDKSGFVQVHKVIPNIAYDIRYYGTDNFLGVQVDGYKAPTAYLTKEAAEAFDQEAANEEFLGEDWLEELEMDDDLDLDKELNDDALLLEEG